ncbi:PP2C family protein-serine/threonine phosphatase [Micrococcus terreus]|uniref:PP2C family protein-serine/threonine phosphatase n=1 Tax=Micrococcus terreus TaxID=574650 RepID=UPI00254FD1DE|nr:protein phosphatase 2C domain-containing protein [Micrococcus terreus]MDK7701235.1 protein phosphatase 2C domain-containing protein [Micrococcus terreus]WOO97757.1 protein phosphatase 2C domain-containing protein [Micrococcus terreus]
MTGEAAAPRPFRLNYGFGSHRGLRRQLNEDSLVVTGNLFAVADGMGGHEAGEVASRICVETLAAGVKEVQDDLTAEDLQHLMVRADEAIREASGARAGTTLAGVAIVREHQGLYWMVFNVGDSRVYRLSEDEFSQVSVDHSEVQEMVDRGYISQAEAQHHPRRHVITRALGTGEAPDADFWMLPVHDGDRLMICSDGLTTEVEDERIRQELQSRHTAQDAVDGLIGLALRGGGRDNITVVVVDVEDSAAESDRNDTSPRDGEERGTTRPRAHEVAPTSTPTEDPS